MNIHFWIQTSKKFFQNFFFSCYLFQMVRGRTFSIPKQFWSYFYFRWTRKRVEQYVTIVMTIYQVLMVYLSSRKFFIIITSFEDHLVKWFFLYENTTYYLVSVSTRGLIGKHIPRLLYLFTELQCQTSKT